MKYIKIVLLTQLMLSIFVQNTLLASEEEAEKQIRRANTLISEHEVSVETKVTSNPYHLNEEQTFARFFPSKASWEKKLNSTEYFFSILFIRGGLSFKGEINLERFVDAMHNALQDFDFLFCQLYRDQGDLYASYSTEDSNNHFIQLEIEKREETLNTSTFASSLPDKIDERMRGGVTDQFQGLPLGAFKLTTLIDGFTVGYYLNHAFFDQSSIVYFFKYLSHLYSNGRDNISLNKPCLVDTDALALSAKQPRIFKNLTEFRDYGEALMGYTYTPRETDNATPKKADDAEPLPQLESYLTIDLNFNVNEINKLKDTANQYLSVNDIIHATLLKIYSFNPDLPLDRVFSFGFACNMRKQCGLGEEAIGNIVSHPLMLLKLQDIKNKTLLELAILNRQRVSEITIEDFKENLVWYRHVQENHENPLHYVPAFNLLNGRATNWSTFNYDNILFDTVAPIVLKALCLAPFRVNVISFDNQDSNKILKSSICVPFNGLDSLAELQQATNLFSYEKRS